MEPSKDKRSFMTYEVVNDTTDPTLAFNSSGKGTYTQETTEAAIQALEFLGFPLIGTFDPETLAVQWSVYETTAEYLEAQKQAVLILNRFEEGTVNGAE